MGLRPSIYLLIVGAGAAHRPAGEHKRKEEGLVGLVHLPPNRGRYFKEHVTYMSLIWIFTKPFKTVMAQQGAMMFTIKKHIQRLLGFFFPIR